VGYSAEQFGVNASSVAADAMYGLPPRALRESGHRQGTRQQRQRLIGEVLVWPIAAYNLGSMGNVLNQRKVMIAEPAATVAGPAALAAYLISSLSY
jgi:hypothetical protein